MANAKADDEIVYVVMRKAGEKKVETKLTGKLFIPEVVEKNLLNPMETMTEDQSKLQRAWLMPSN